MSSSVVSQTLQGAVLSSLSNILAQLISAYNNSEPFSLNPTPVLKFALFSIISNPPNIYWQSFLEDLFPSKVPVPASQSEKANGTSLSKKRDETQLSKTNILIKFILDQTIGAVVNTVMFLAFMSYVNAPPGGNVWDLMASDVRHKLYPMIRDGWKVWPIFSLISFLWIPVDKRIVAGCLVGIGWGIYLSFAVEA